MRRFEGMRHRGAKAWTKWRGLVFEQKQERLRTLALFTGLPNAGGVPAGTLSRCPSFGSSIGTAWVQKVGPREPCVIYTHASLPTLRKGWPLCDRQTGDAKGDQLAQLAAPDPRPLRHLQRL